MESKQTNQSSGSSSPTFVDTFAPPLDIALLVKKQGAEKGTWVVITVDFVANEKVS